MSGAREVEQGRFRRKLYLRVAGMSLGGRREAGSAHTYDNEEEGVGGPPSPAMLGREQQGTLIGTRRQWVRAVAEDDRVNVAPSHLPRRRGSGWICDQR